jgi:DNA-binding transcriptional LysR family regulator
MTDLLGLASVFLACADSGGFSAAGRKLGLSRSAVGKAIARLEAQLGVRLIHRTTRTLKLTDDGHIYYERAVRAVAELEEARTILDAGRREPAGLLRVTAPVVLGRHRVAPILFRLAARHTDLKLTLSLTDRPVDLIEEGFDLAVRVGRLPNTSDLMGRRISQQQMTICSSPAYLQRRGMPVDQADLSNHDLVVYGRNAAVNLSGSPATNGTARVRLDDLETLADAATIGMGLASLPCWLVADRIAAGTLVRVLPDFPRQTFDIYALWPKAPFMPIRVRAALEALVAELPLAPKSSR